MRNTNQITNHHSMHPRPPTPLYTRSRPNHRQTTNHTTKHFSKDSQQDTRYIINPLRKRHNKSTMPLPLSRTKEGLTKDDLQLHPRLRSNQVYNRYQITTTLRRFSTTQQKETSNTIPTTINLRQSIQDSMQTKTRTPPPSQTSKHRRCNNSNNHHRNNSNLYHRRPRLPRQKDSCRHFLRPSTNKFLQHSSPSHQTQTTTKENTPRKTSHCKRYTPPSMQTMRTRREKRRTRRPTVS